jgi:hypothetical protein
VSEADFRLVVLFGDLKADSRAHPLGLVLNIVHMVLQDEPLHLFVRDALDDPELGIVDIPDAIRELVADIGVAAFDVFAPPFTNVVDGLENFLRGSVDDK